MPGAGPGQELLERLRRDHEATREALDELSRLVPKVAEGDEGLLSQVRQLVLNLREGEQHEIAEEDILFPALRARSGGGIPLSLTQEHNHLRAEIRKLYEASIAPGLEPAGRSGRLFRILDRMAPLLRSHMRREEELVFPQAEEVLDEKGWEEVLRGCREVGYLSSPGTPAASSA